MQIFLIEEIQVATTELASGWNETPALASKRSLCACLAIKKKRHPVTGAFKLGDYIQTKLGMGLIRPG
jgi:hypothetical protein